MGWTGAILHLPSFFFFFFFFFCGVGGTPPNVL
jgi:hypothetical protein